jgi:hypothetical protein
VSAARLATAIGRITSMLLVSCAPISSSSSSASPPAPEVIRAANRISPNEDKAVVLEGLAVEVAGRACVHFDRNDAIVPIAGRASWEPALLNRPVRARGTLKRHADQNDPVTGIASLELVGAAVEPIALPNDRRLRTAPALRAAEGSHVEVEGVAYRSPFAPALCVYGGMAWVRGLGLRTWDAATMDKIIVVRGTLKREPLPPEAPPVEAWFIDAESFAIVR